MHMIDELVGHETALPSLLGTNRAGLGELRVDLATAVREGKRSRAIKFSPLRMAPAPRIRSRALGVAGGNNPSETMIKTGAESPTNKYQFLTNFGRMSRLNPGASTGDQWVSRVNRYRPSGRWRTSREERV